MKKIMIDGQIWEIKNFGSWSLFMHLLDRPDAGMFVQPRDFFRAVTSFKKEGRFAILERAKRPTLPA